MESTGFPELTAHKTAAPDSGGSLHPAVAGSLARIQRLVWARERCRDVLSAKIDAERECLAWLEQRERRRGNGKVPQDIAAHLE